MSEIFKIETSFYDRLNEVIPEHLLSYAGTDENAVIYGIECDGKTVGTIVVRVLGSEAELLWFAVDPAYRGYYIGTESFEDLLVELHQQDVEEIFMNIAPGTDPDLLKIIDSYSPVWEPGSGCVVTVSGDKLHSCNKLKKNNIKSRSLLACDDTALRSFAKRLEEAGEDIYPITKEGYDGAASAVFMNGEVAEGVLLLTPNGRDMELTFIASLASDVSAVIDMLSYSAQALSEFPEDAVIRMNILDEKLKEFAVTVFSLEEEMAVTSGKRARIDLDFLTRIQNNVDFFIELSQEYSYVR